MEPQQSPPQPQPVQVEPSQPEQPKKKPGISLKAPYIAVIIGVLVVFVFIIMFFISASKPEKKQAAKTNTQVNKGVVKKPATIGSMKLEATTPSVLKTQPVTLTLIADSSKYIVSGYDALVAYDTEAFDFVKGASLIKDFSIYTFKRSGHVTVTAVKALQSNTPSVFANTPVMELTFQPKKTGSYVFSIKKMIGAENTSFVSTKSKKLSPLVNTVSIIVE